MPEQRDQAVVLASAAGIEIRGVDALDARIRFARSALELEED
jgi:hypothetical protein